MSDQAIRKAIDAEIKRLQDVRSMLGPDEMTSIVAVAPELSNGTKKSTAAPDPSKDTGRSVRQKASMKMRWKEARKWAKAAGIPLPPHVGKAFVARCKAIVASRSKKTGGTTQPKKSAHAAKEKKTAAAAA